MALTAQTIVAWHDRTTAQHADLRDTWAKQDFRPLSVTVYGTPQDPLYAAVMVKRPQLIATRSFIGLSQAEFQQTFEDMAKQDFGPFLITATGPSGGHVYAASFRHMANIPLTRSNLSKSEFVTLNRQQHDAGAILLSADAFGMPGDPRYCAVWAPNPERVAWNVDAVDEGGATLQQRFEAMTSSGARPALVSVTPAGRIMELFVDSQVGPWTSRAGMTSAEYQAEFDKQAKADLWPVCVSASGAGSGARFAAIFAHQEERLPRVFRRSTQTPAIAQIDAQMKKYVQDQNLRGAALAIVQGTRLVYAGGYTFAEAAPAYADIGPQTPFRQASVSKTFCATAIWKLIERNDLKLDDTLQSVLDLEPFGATPVADNFEDITIRHLLESRSGINQGLVWGAVDASAAAGGALPSDGQELARWISGKALMSTPGSVSVYGNTDYFLLSLVVMKKMKAASFENALQTLVLGPLHQTHTRGSQSAAGAQAAGEARHHLTVHNPGNGWALLQLETASGVKTPSRPLVASQYGSYDFEMFDGAGGLSSSVVDVARLCAMFSARSTNPVLAKGTIGTMFARAISATNVYPGSHGFHGFDGAGYVGLTNDHIACSKGGWLPGQGTFFTGTTGGLFYVIAQNGNSRQDVDTNWLKLVQPIAEAHDWGTADLFPTFGMPSFGPESIQPQPASTSFVMPAQMLEQVEASMAKTRSLALEHAAVNGGVG
jgi:CubicO group peptidase (beta-lactamase class C family)